MFKICIIIVFLAVLAVLSGWSVLREWSQNSWDPNRVLSRLHSRYGATPFFKIQLFPDPSRPGALIIGILPSGLGLPDKSYYFLGHTNEIITAYKILMINAVSLLGANGRDASIFADDVFGYEQRLASITPDNIDLETVPPIVTSMGELRSATLSVGCCRSIPIQEIITGLMPMARINDATKILMTSPFYIKHLPVVMSTTERSILNNYMIWTLIREYLPYLSSPFRDVLQEYNSKLTGSSFQEARWEFCTSLIYKTLPLAVNYILQNITNTEDSSNTVFKMTKRSVDNLFLNIKNVLISKIQKTDWIENQLKRHWILKTDKMNFQLGIPTFALHTTFLKEYYSGLMVQKYNLFQNVAYIFEFSKERLQKTYLAALRSNERSIPEKTFSPVVEYDQSRNILYVPMASATPPYFHFDFPEPIQYGRLGVQMATVIMSAVLRREVHLAAGGGTDLHLSPIDETMNLLHQETLNCSLNCLEKLMINTFGINETIANITKESTLIHISGVKLALEAMHMGTFRDSRFSVEHEHFPGLESFEDVHLFALSYAQDQCGLTTKEGVFMENYKDMTLDTETMFQLSWLQNEKFHDFIGCRSYTYCEKIL